MNRLRTSVIIVAAFASVFAESTNNWLRQWLGAQVDLLPILMVYTGLTAGPLTVTVVGVCGGLWFDALSANPLGISVLPLVAVGLLAHRFHESVLQEQMVAQFLLGLGACALVPVVTLMLLVTVGQDPLAGWGSLWQWGVMSLEGACLRPSSSGCWIEFSGRSIIPCCPKALSDRTARLNGDGSDHVDHRPT